MMNVLLALGKRNKNTLPYDKENGLTIVEIMVAVVIIAAILVFTASSLTTSFREAVYAENRTKAQAYANDVLAIAKQAPYRKVFIPTMDDDVKMFNAQACYRSYNPTGAPSQSALRKTGEGTTPYTGLVECQKRQAGNASGNIGAEFWINTRVYMVSGTKKVYVTVRWVDISSPGGVNILDSNITLSPDPEDCYVTLAGQTDPAATLQSLNSTIPGCN